MNEIEMALDEEWGLVQITGKPKVLLLKGLSGFGKTAITRQWLEKKGLKSYWIDAPAYISLDFDTIQKINSKDIVFVIDNYCFAIEDIRTKLLPIIRKGVVHVAEEGQVELENLLFVVMLNDEEKDRLTVLERNLFYSND